MANELPSGVVESSNDDDASLGGFAYASSIRQPFIRGTRGEVLALPGSEWDTAIVTGTTDAGEYRYFNGAWRVWSLRNPITISTFQNGFYAGEAAPRVYVRSGFGSLTGSLYRNTAPAGGVTAFVLPNGVNPPPVLDVKITNVPQNRFTQISATGTVSVGSDGPLTSGFGFPISGFTWPLNY